MQWYNEPDQWQSQDNQLQVAVRGKTDFWRVTLHDFIKDDAHFYYQEVTGDFIATVKFIGDYIALYDQAGLMVRENELIWMKCGIEYVGGIQQANAVITRDFSDWSIMPLADNPRSVWIRVQRTASALEVYFSRDGETFTMIRQGYLSTKSTLQVGMMCASPQGDGFNVVFENYSIEQR